MKIGENMIQYVSKYIRVRGSYIIVAFFYEKETENGKRIKIFKNVSGEWNSYEIENRYAWLKCVDIFREGLKSYRFIK